MAIATTQALVKGAYEKLKTQSEIVRGRLGRPLTLAEKILAGHMLDPKGQDLARGSSFLLLNPDRVAMQDATAQMALLQFMLSGRKEAAVPSTVHCDHLIQAYEGEEKDMGVALDAHKEVFNFLSSVSKKYGIGFWKPGAGIIHQVVLEHYAFPGGLIIGTDSHTPNAGGLGMLAVGVGGADAVDVMADMPWEVKNPKLIGVKLTGKLSGWTSPKDIILKLCGLLTVKGGTNKIVEYFGEGCDSISCTGKATITNMGAELGATCSVFPFDKKMEAYLNLTERKEICNLALEYKDYLVADPEVAKSPEDYYDEVVEINLETLEPHIVGPHSPDRARSLSEVKKDCEENGFNPTLSAALIGSCTNSSYEDISRATHVAQQALDKGIRMPQGFMVSPGSSQIKKTIERDGHMTVLEKVGAVVLANACGPCIGQWRRDLPKGQTNTIVTSFNRNFRGRNDANPETLSFIASPEVVMAMGLAGRLDFDPRRDKLTSENGEEFMLEAPQGVELPVKGFVSDESAYQEPVNDASLSVEIRQESDRLQALTPFLERKVSDFQDMVILCKALGKCTTDHISPAGPWLKYRGHLENISRNMLMGANNVFAEGVGQGRSVLEEAASERPISELALHYKKQKQSWVVIGDENYGEGSSREHAAMCPRFLGASCVIVRSFARIHETNLKKQGVLPLVFKDPKDYDLFQAEDRLSLCGLEDLSPGKDVVLKLTHQDGSSEEVALSHSLNEDQIKWFWSGSALNCIRKELES